MKALKKEKRKTKDGKNEKTERRTRECGPFPLTSSFFIFILHSPHRPFGS
jgi:hypothetical protein